MNMMKYCPECYKELPPNSASCPFCGYSTAGADQAPKAPSFLKTPQTDSFLPPEQTVLSVLLLMILFWGVNISAAVFPIYIQAGTTRNILIAAILSQVLTRSLIGVWALREQSLKKDVTTNQKIAAFSLAIVPVAAIMSFLQAARTAIRKDWLSQLTIAAVSAVMIMSLLLYGTKDGISALSTGKPQGQNPAATPNPAVEALYDPESTLIPATATPRTYLGGCRNPNSVTVDEVGEVIEICGEVTNFGDKDCEACPLGFYSFIKLDGGFQIVSYDWRFSFAWLGDCMRVSDKVELLGDIPVFVFGKGEGYAGTQCKTDAQGELNCDGGYYFQDYFNCDAPH